MKAHECSLVNRRLGNCNLLVLVVIIAHLFRKVNNLQKKFLCIFIYLLQFTRTLLSSDSVLARKAELRRVRRERHFMSKKSYKAAESIEDAIHDNRMFAERAIYCIANGAGEL